MKSRFLNYRTTARGAVQIASAYLTRKPCYRKDDRAMRPIYGYMP